MPSVIGVDVGGTFTDVVRFDNGSLSGRKVPTSADQSAAIADVVRGTQDDVFLHGTTAATNTLIEERGARVALVTDPGYEDLIEIGRQDRPALYDSASDRSTPLVARADRIGVVGDEADLASLVGETEADIVVVGLIDSYLDPERERTIAAGLEERLEAPVIAASDISPEFREYERLATVVLSAYLTPSVSRYLHSLDRSLPMDVRLVMTSSGGLVPFSGAAAMAGRLVLSGPAGGVVASAALGRSHGFEQVLSFDMGGTSTDVSRISGGALAIASGHTVAGRVNRVPSVPIRTIGAGGGSVGWADDGGALRVGPGSAGAIPGPAAYGFGGEEPTITDANLIAGHLPSDLALGGSLSMDIGAARGAMAMLGETLGLGIEDTASGMLEVVDSLMEHALRSVSVEEGADPRKAVIVAFGGAGGLHATQLARRLGVTKVMIPPLSGVFSALGLLLAAPRTDLARTVMLAEDDERLGQLAASLRNGVAAEHEEVFGLPPEAIVLSFDMRYVGQSHELEITGDGRWDELRWRFDAAHATRFGFQRPGEAVEVVNIRATSRGSAPFHWSDLPRLATMGAPSDRGGVWDRGTLPVGFEIQGPAVVTEANSATLLNEGDRMMVLDDGALEISCE